MPVRPEPILADITRLEVAAIVNAANPSLLGGGGVDGAIHRTAGPGLLRECRAIPADALGHRCPPGEARITAGHNLRARFVIHTAGPIWRGGSAGEPETLAACYRNCLALAASRALESIAFPAISCGIYGYPIDQAAAIAVAELDRFLAGSEPPRIVVVACFDAEMFEVYARLLVSPLR